MAEDVQVVLRDPCNWCAQIDVMNGQTGRGIKEVTAQMEVGHQKELTTMSD